MYITYMKEIPYEYYNFHSKMFKDNVYLREQDEIDNIFEFIERFGINEYEKIFNIFDIKYNSISDNGFSYTIPDSTKMLSVSYLPSGKRLILYAAIMSKLNKPLILVGLADRLDKKHRDILMNFPEYFKTTIAITFKDTYMNELLIDKYYMSFEDIIKTGLM